MVQRMAELTHEEDASLYSIAFILLHAAKADAAVMHACIRAFSCRHLGFVLRDSIHGDQNLKSAEGQCCHV